MGLKEINLTILVGEIMGVAGVSGNGQRELGDVVLGLESCSSGSKYLFGQDATQWSVAQVRSSGVAFIPEDPLSMAAFPGLTVQENIALGDSYRYSRQSGLSVDWKSVRDDFELSLHRLGYTIPSVDMHMGALSGGNVQRVIVAREMGRDPKLILALYPTRGLDVHSAMAVRKLLVESRNRGVGVLLMSEDLEELFSLSDRLVILFRGQIVGTSAPGEITPKEIGYLMTGSNGKDKPIE